MGTGVRSIATVGTSAADDLAAQFADDETIGQRAIENVLPPRISMVGGPPEPSTNPEANVLFMCAVNMDVLNLYKTIDSIFRRRLITAFCRLRGHPGSWQRFLEPEPAGSAAVVFVRWGAAVGAEETKAPLRIASRATFGAPLPPAGQAPSLY